VALLIAAARESGAVPSVTLRMPLIAQRIAPSSRCCSWER